MLSIDAALPQAEGWTYHRLFEQNLKVPPGGGDNIVDLSNTRGYLKGLRIVVDSKDAEIELLLSGSTIFKGTPDELNTQGLTAQNPSGLPWLENYDTTLDQYCISFTPVNSIPYSSLVISVKAPSSTLLTVRKIEGLIVQVLNSDLFEESIADAFVPSIFVDLLDKLETFPFAKLLSRRNGSRQ